MRLYFSYSMSALIKFTPGWVLIQVNISPIQEIGPKVGYGRSFVRLWYMIIRLVCQYIIVSEDRCLNRCNISFTKSQVEDGFETNFRLSNLRHFSTTCAVHIEDCGGWWLSGCCNSVAEGFNSWWLPAFSLSSIFAS